MPYVRTNRSQMIAAQHFFHQQFRTSECLCSARALKWIMHGRNSVDVTPNRCAHYGERLCSRHSFNPAFLRDRLKCRSFVTASLADNGRPAIAFAVTDSSVPLTGDGKYDTILIGPRQVTRALIYLPRKQNERTIDATLPRARDCLLRLRLLDRQRKNLKPM